MEVLSGIISRLRWYISALSVQSLIIEATKCAKVPILLSKELMTSWEEVKEVKRRNTSAQFGMFVCVGGRSRLPKRVGGIWQANVFPCVGGPA